VAWALALVVGINLMSGDVSMIGMALAAPAASAVVDRTTAKGPYRYPQRT
jgi:hypothetical protein